MVPSVFSSVEPAMHAVHTEAAEVFLVSRPWGQVVHTLPAEMDGRKVRMGQASHTDAATAVRPVVVAPTARSLVAVMPVRVPAGQAVHFFRPAAGGPERLVTPLSHTHSRWQAPQVEVGHRVR